MATPRRPAMVARSASAVERLAARPRLSSKALRSVAAVESGHYPMQEMPPRTVALLERFLSAAVT